MSPPPYNQITGIYTVDDKHQNISRADYDGLAKPGQIVVDTSDYSLWIGNDSGNLTQVGAGSSNVGLYSVIYVTKNGNDAAADGSMTSPFLTITGALNYINTVYPVTAGSGQQVVIVLGPGTYTENISLTRFLTHFTGLESKQKTTRINGQITINSSIDYSGLYQNEISFSNLFIANTNSPCITVTGSQPTSLEIYGCSLYTSGTGIPFVMNNTASGGNKLRIYNSDITAVGNATAVDISNVSNGAITNINTSSASTTDGWKFATSTITLGNIQLTSSTCANLISVASGTINIGYSAFTSTATNGTGVNVASGATYVAGSVVYNIAAGTGYAVKGVAGSVFVYSYNSIMPGTNARISSAMTSIPMTTSFTSVA